MKILIAMPVYNDWAAALILCGQIQSELQQDGQHMASLLLIDDGSTIAPSLPDLQPHCRTPVQEIGILELCRNLGHQRAIAIGLTYIQQNLSCDAVVVMDADGEDRAQDIPVLLRAFQQNPDAVVFAERGRRVEGLLFKFGYLFYRALHRLATGKGIKVGNFSVVPFSRLHTLVVLPELWNHYAAAVLRARLPYSTVLADRGTRLQGRSRMNFTSLVIHGLSALFAQYELVGTRVFVFLTACTTVLFLFLLLAFSAGIAHAWTLPLWTVVASATALLFAGELLAIAFGLVFFIMVSRTNSGFLPVRDYGYFVRHYRSVLAE